MKIDAFLTPFFPETENQFQGNIVVMIDVLRAGTTICAALCHGAREIIPTEKTEKAVSIYSSLSKETRFLGGERNCVKPNGFDAGNSPLEYTEEAVSGRTVIITTTNGTKTFQKAKQAAVRIIGGFVNLNVVIDYINDFINGFNDPKDCKITFLCAGTNGRLSYEDTLCSGAFINEIIQRYDNIELTDTADAAKNLFILHSLDLKEFLSNREHASLLQELGYARDIDEALALNKYPVVPIFDGNSVKSAL